MPKAVISNRIYLGAHGDVLDNIKKALTYKLEVSTMSRAGKAVKSFEIIRTYKVLPGNVISIPQGRLDLIPEGYEIVDKRILNDMPFPVPSKHLRSGQQEVYDKVEDTCIINALVGWGKTMTALHVARKLGQKTLVITHTTMLRDQWIKEIKELYNMDVGIVGSGTYDIDHAIVVGNIQSLTKYTLELHKEFGTVILDEMHHSPASTFSSFIDAMHARYRIGLSGTIIRKDGKHVLFPDFFGHTVFKPPQSHTTDPVVRIIRSGVALTPGEPWVKKVNNLLYDTDYQEYVAAIAAYQATIGHKVLIVADRVEFLTNVKEILGEQCVLVTGETGLEERDAISSKLETGEISCIAGSRQIFSEGISINALSCLVLATPIANEISLEQLAGRIMRLYPGKLTPSILDINFSGIADRKQNNLRLGFYLKKGWEVIAN